MGLFSNLFGSSSNIEKPLEEAYVPMLQVTKGMSLSEAKSTLHNMLSTAKEYSQKQGTLNLPQNFGDILLEKESRDGEIKSMLAKRRNEGVRDEDIKWWWNMHDLERSMMQLDNDISRFGLFKKLREEDGLNMEAVVERVRSVFPMYGNPGDTSHTSGKDRPLPDELRHRINIYLQKRYNADPEQFKKEIEESSTFNSLIRKEIEKGNV